MQHPLIRTPAQRLLNARQDHARCLRLVAWYRRQLSSGVPAMRDRHDWALGQARKLRLRFPGLLSHLEEAAQTALDAADKIIAVLDRIEGADEGDASLAAMSAHAGQVGHLREAPEPIEIEPVPEPDSAPQEPPPAEPVPPEAASEEIALSEPIYEPVRLPWRGAGNVVAAAGCAVLALMARM